MNEELTLSVWFDYEDCSLTFLFLGNFFVMDWRANYLLNTLPPLFGNYMKILFLLVVAVVLWLVFQQVVSYG